MLTISFPEAKLRLGDAQAPSKVKTEQIPDLLCVS